MISIIIPIYKVEKFLKRCIESILNQTYKELEIILVDDGSPDNCPKICDEYAQKDKRIKVVHKKNGGLSSARNAGLEIATGDFVYFLDSDDYIDSNALEVMINNIEDNDVLVFGYVKEFSNKSIICDFANISHLDSKHQLKTLMSSWAFGFVWNKLYKRSIIDIEFNLVPREDLDFNARLFKRVNKFKIISGTYHHYVQQENSITHKVQKISFDSLINCHKYMLDFLNSKQYSELIPYQNTAFLKSLINIFKYDKFVEKQEKNTKSNYDYIYKSDYVCDALKKYKCNNLKEKIFILLIKYKMINLLKSFLN